MQPFIDACCGNQCCTTIIVAVYQETARWHNGIANYYIIHNWSNNGLRILTSNAATVISVFNDNQPKMSYYGYDQPIMLILSNQWGDIQARNNPWIGHDQVSSKNGAANKLPKSFHNKSMQIEHCDGQPSNWSQILYGIPRSCASVGKPGLPSRTAWGLQQRWKGRSRWRRLQDDVLPQPQTKFQGSGCFCVSSRPFRYPLFGHQCEEPGKTSLLPLGCESNWFFPTPDLRWSGWAMHG